MRANSGPPIILMMMFSLLACSAVGQNLGAVCPGWSVTGDVRMALDINRDGKADLAAFDNPDSFNQSALWTAINTGSESFTVQKALYDLDAANAGDPTKHVRMLVDLNGDHIPDIVIFGDAGVWTSLSQQNPRVAQVTPAVPIHGPSPVEPPTLFSTPTLVLQNFGVQQGWDPQKHLRFVVDVNHDGFADIVGFGDAGVWVALGNGDGTFQTPKLVVPNFGANQGWSPAKHVRLLADLNHDGYPDIVAFGDQGVFTAMNNGDASGTFKPVQAGLQPQNFGSDQGWSVEKHVRLTAVLSTVGYADIIGFGDQGVWTAVGNGDGTFQTPKLVLANFGVAQGWDPAKHVRLMADLNHDGRDDIVAFGDAGVWTAMSAVQETLAPVKLNSPQSLPPGNIPLAEPGAGTFDTPRLVLQNFGVKQDWSPAKHIRVMADLNGDNFPDIVGFGDGGVWTALGNGDGTFQNAQFPLDYFACNGRFDFNVESSQTDLNGFPLNPQWRWQLYNPAPGTPLTPQTETPNAAMCHYFSNQIGPSFSDCTDQTDMSHVNGASGFPNQDVCGIGAGSGFPGHLNWFTATFQAFHSAQSEGLSWGDHNTDDDYDMPLIVSKAPAIMNDRPDLHTEADASETYSNFETPWWNGFVQNVPGLLDPGNPVPLLLLHDADAIMTGMFGVDCEHDGCKSEMHPIFTLAAHVVDNPDNDTWVMYLRNTGDEGYCSSQMESANFTSYTFRLPWRTEETIPWNTVEVLWGPMYPACAQAQELQAKSCFEQQVPPGGATGPTITYLSGQWVDVTFTFPGPQERPLIDGELHLQWGRGRISNGPLVASSPASTSPARSSAPSAEQEKEPDESGPLGIALGKLGPAQQSQIRKTVAAATASGAKMQAMPAGQPAREVTSEPPAHPAVRIGEAGPAATEKAARDAAMVRELCKAYGGSIEGAPANMCKN